MLGNILAVMRRSHSPSASIAQIDDWVADLRVRTAPAESRGHSQQANEAASAGPSASPPSDDAAKLAKLLRNRKRSQEYTRRLDAQIAAIVGRARSDQDPDQDQDQEQTDDSPKTLCELLRRRCALAPGS